MFSSTLPSHAGFTEPRGRTRLLFCLVPALVVLLNIQIRGEQSMHVDEVYWIGSTYYYDLYFHQGDLAHPDWRLLPARENPPIGKYLMGLWLDIHGRRIQTPDLLGSFYLLFPPERGGWGTGEALRKRRAIADRVSPDIARRVRQSGRVPLDPADLAAARTLIVVLAMICAAFLCLIGLQCGTLTGGLLAGIAFALHRAVFEAYSNALIDMIALTFSCIAVSLYIAIVKPAADRKSPARFGASFALALGLGLALAGAYGAKMNALIVVFLGILILGWLTVSGVRRRGSALALASGLVISLALFIIFNPALYGNVIDGIGALFYEHQATIPIQMELGNKLLGSFPERFDALGLIIFRFPALLWVMTLLVLYQAWAHWRHGRREQPGLAIIVIWWILAFGLLLAWMPFGWSRYALPLVPPTLLLLGKCADDLLRIFRARTFSP